MRVYFVMRYIRLKILGPLFFAFTCFTLLSEIFKWRKAWDSLSMPHSPRHDASIPSRGHFSFHPPLVAPNQTNFVPGRFLKGVLPQNESYCHFSYGTPEHFNWTAPEALVGGKLQTFRQREGLTYPVNVGRNVARKAAKTSHVLVSDVELLPSQDLVSAFLSMLSRFRKQRVEGDSADIDLNPPLPIMQESRMKNFVFVLPVFEVDEKESNVPRTKEELLELYAQNKAVYFHRWVCLHCQRFPGLQRWLQRKPSAENPNIIQPLLVVRREFPYHRWEPIYIGTSQEPLYSEQLTWEGQQDKMTQMNEMCLKGYRFIILDGAFLVHVPGIKRKSEITMERTAWRHPHERHNIEMYHSITAKMMSKYGTNTRCKL
ncbi:beta-1,4-glucuronyltransferase 1 isoform X2 [Cryptotermes secundus]|uniref:beta-1,4-glucuronyltransferase 1 isoform X2 n=1 Tax=Cryptotermes secundus TaxID=105785 RepID=UPI000CD7DEC8|nr:beta-1,4-glucuronyltransferase 1 isoform X2 [Cryptotermes secundus]